MSLDKTTGPELTTTGQAQEASGGGGGQPAPETTHTQPEQAKSTQAEAESVHPDFYKLPPEERERLEPYYKAMQADYTRKTQTLAKQRKAEEQKIQAYNEFMSNPVENLKRMAQQYGMTLTTAQAQAVVDQQNQQQRQGVSPDWSPNTWDEVFAKAGEYVSPIMQEKLQELEQRHQQELAELRATVGEYRQEKVSKQLAEIDPEWHQYEPQMRELLDEIPGLARNISALYRAAVPLEVIQARANQAALKKYEAKTQAAKVESSGHSKSSSPAPKGPMTFEEAFQAAKRELGRR